MTWREHSYNAYILGVIGILGCIWLVVDFPVILRYINVPDSESMVIVEIVFYGIAVITFNLFFVLIVGTYKVSFNSFGALTAINIFYTFSENSLASDTKHSDLYFCVDLFHYCFILCRKSRRGSLETFIFRYVKIVILKIK